MIEPRRPFHPVNRRNLFDTYRGATSCELPLGKRLDDAVGGDAILTSLTNGGFDPIAHPFRGRDANQEWLGLQVFIEYFAGIVVPWTSYVQP